MKRRFRRADEFKDENNGKRGKEMRKIKKRWERRGTSYSGLRNRI